MIMYRETAYHCQCECGQRFFVFMGHCQRKTIRPPHLVSSLCPACQKAAWLTYDVRKKGRKELPKYTGPRDPGLRAYEGRMLYEELPILEQCVEHYKLAYQQAANHLASLQATVEATLDYWDHHWQRSIMPTQFAAMARCLKEQAQDVS
jgi:hypothetical protein